MSNKVEKTIPAALATRLSGLEDIVTAAYDSGFNDGHRDGYREGRESVAKERRELAGVWNDHGTPLVAGIERAIGFDQADMHGEPLHDSGPQRKKVALHGGHQKVIDLLSSERSYAAPTIAGLIGVKRDAVWTYLSQIDLSDEWTVVKKRLEGRGRGYTTLYRVERAA